MSETQSTISIKVSGRVQGVWFRASTKNEADRLGIKGFVKNERDGGVYIEATGDSHALDEFIKWCKIGPELARVHSLEVKDEAFKKFEDFEVRRKWKGAVEIG